MEASDGTKTCPCCKGAGRLALPSPSVGFGLSLVTTTDGKDLGVSDGMIAGEMFNLNFLDGTTEVYRVVHAESRDEDGMRITVRFEKRRSPDRARPQFLPGEGGVSA